MTFAKNYLIILNYTYVHPITLYDITYNNLFKIAIACQRMSDDTIRACLLSLNSITFI